MNVLCLGHISRQSHTCHQVEHNKEESVKKVTKKPSSQHPLLQRKEGSSDNEMHLASSLSLVVDP